MITVQEEFERLGRILELVQELEQLSDGLRVAPVRAGELRGFILAAGRAAKEHYAAAEILLTHELATTFPDGSEAPACLTPRQVMYLASLAHQRPGRELVGLPASRPCAEETKDGYKCSAFSLLFTERAICGSHATAAERERNRKAKANWQELHPDYAI